MTHDKTQGAPLKNSAPGKAPAKPPDERFWQRYSPHYEFPLSSTTSFVLHGIAIVALIYVASIFALGEDSKPLSMDAVVIAGGGGNIEGVGAGPGDGVPPAPGKEDLGKENVKEQAKPVVKPESLTTPAQSDLQVPEMKHTRFVESNEQLGAVAKQSADLKRKLMEGLMAGRGQGGSGRGGGKGSGVGTGEGPNSGPGKNNISVREKRNNRWTMIFNTDPREHGDDYRRQLLALGATIAFPEPDGTYVVIRDLSRRPFRGTPCDLSSFHGIRWSDEKAESVRSLFTALGLPAPPFFIAYFPESLERDLLEKELRYRNLSEDEIQKTKFDVVRHGGRYVPEVIRQLKVGEPDPEVRDQR